MPLRRKQILALLVLITLVAVYLVVRLAI